MFFINMAVFSVKYELRMTKQSRIENRTYAYLLAYDSSR